MTLFLQRRVYVFCETQLPASIGWVALSSVVRRSVVCPASVTSPHLHYMMFPTNVSNHTNHIFSVRIGSWQHVSVSISSVDELSPVYCCLVSSWSWIENQGFQYHLSLVGIGEILLKYLKCWVVMFQSGGHASLMTFLSWGNMIFLLKEGRLIVVHQKYLECRML